MHRYFIKTPWIVSRLFSSYTWHFPRNENKVYLTFDDGPHPQITPWVLDQLRLYDARCSFFCIGENVQRYPGVYGQILAEGHSVGNHTHRHLRGWNTSVEEYVKDVRAASREIKSSLFRPPYGRIRSEQARQLKEEFNGMKIIMWDVLSADFDQGFSGEQCLSHVKRNIRPGSVVVFHDSEKAYENLKVCLPGVLGYVKEKGWEMASIPMKGEERSKKN